LNNGTFTDQEFNITPSLLILAIGTLPVIGTYLFTFTFNRLFANGQIEFSFFIDDGTNFSNQVVVIPSDNTSVPVPAGVSVSLTLSVTSLVLSGGITLSAGSSNTILMNHMSYIFLHS
jgi:hypothetical protein